MVLLPAAPHWSHCILTGSWEGTTVGMEGEKPMNWHCEMVHTLLAASPRAAQSLLAASPTLRTLRSPLHLQL